MLKTIAITALWWAGTAAGTLAILSLQAALDAA